jgi:hypothetical protein
MRPDELFDFLSVSLLAVVGIATVVGTLSLLIVWVGSRSDRPKLTRLARNMGMTTVILAAYLAVLIGFAVLFDVVWIIMRALQQHD